MKHTRAPIAPALELAEKLRSTALNGKMLRLHPPLVAVLMDERIYEQICALEAEEIRRTCRAETVNDNDIKLATTGSGSGRITEPGASAGATIIPMDAASRGASRLLREETETMRRRKKR